MAERRQRPATETRSEARQPWRVRITGEGTEAPDQLLANPWNYKVHTQYQKSVLAGLLDEVGWVRRILVNTTTSHVVDGHARISAALERGETSVPVEYCALTEAEERLVLASLDPSIALAGTDRELLAHLLQDVQSSTSAVQHMLSELAQREGIVPTDTSTSVPEPEPQLDRAEELRQHYGVEVGQLWALGQHRILCGDCTNRTSVELLMDGVYGQMIFTDPPYGVDYDGGMKKRKRLDNDIRGTNIYARALPVLASYVDKQAPLYLWYADAHSAAAAAAAAAAGYVIVAQIVWAKNHAQFMSSAHYHGKHEPCFYAHKHGKSARWYGGTTEVTLWNHDRSPSNDFHPTQKPVALATRALTNSTQPGDICLDGFLGGGSTLIACEHLNRRCFGCEIDPGYVAVILERWREQTGQYPTLLETLPTADTSESPERTSPHHPCHGAP